MRVLVQGHTFGRPMKWPVIGGYKTGDDVETVLEEGQSKPYLLGVGPDGQSIETTFGCEENGVQFSLRGSPEVSLGGMPVGNQEGVSSAEVKAVNPVMPNFWISARPERS